MMTKKELIESLEKYSDDTTVLFMPEMDGEYENGEAVKTKPCLAVSDPLRDHELEQLAPIGVVETVDYPEGSALFDHLHRD